MNILDIIKEKYPKAVFTPINFNAQTGIGFVLTETNLVVGLINKDGSLCKLTEPIDLKLLDKDSFYKIITKLPIANNITGTLHELVHDKQQVNITIQDLQKELVENAKYKILYDESQKDFIAIKKEYQDVITELKQSNECIDQISNEHEIIRNAIINYKTQVDEFIKQNKLSYQEIIKIYTKINKEIELIINQSQNNIKLELEELKKEFSTEKLKNTFYKECNQQILSEKDELVTKIKEFKNDWKNWIENNNFSIIEQKNQIKQELIKINEIIKNLLNTASDKKTLQSIKQVQNEIKKTSIEQLNDILKKEKEIAALQEEVGTLSDQNQELTKELNQIRVLLKQNIDVKLQDEYNYDKCFSVMNDLIQLNNLFSRKLEIISLIDKIFQQKQNNKLYEKYTIIKTNITNLIKFLDLEKYVKSTNMTFFKNKSTMNKIPQDFCNEIINILEYWNINKDQFTKDDLELTNIYEDLSGAIRVYVRIKPLNNTSEKIPMTIVDKNLSIDCNKNRQIYENFYNIYNDTFTNADIFTGETSIKGDQIIFNNIQVNKTGFYNLFKQLESGYSLVIMGYGNSGSGKTHTLLGSDNIPGLFQYGLSNLSNVENIRVQYIFEQYTGPLNLNFGKITGKIHNLVGQIPQLELFSKDERANFQKTLGLDIKHLEIDDLDLLVKKIDEYRTNMGRIKETPNNKTSSRSHLYIMLDIEFSNGVIGHLTLIDMAGKESPLDIFTKFFDKSKTSLPSIMSSSGISFIDKYNKLPEYKSEYILSLLKESFYINETLGHLIYFLDPKTKITIQSQNLDQYDVDKYYVSPIREETQLKSDNNCLTIPIFKFISKFSQQQKYIMIANIRQEIEYCDETFNTLNFVNKIKST